MVHGMSMSYPSYYHLAIVRPVVTGGKCAILEPHFIRSNDG